MLFINTHPQALFLCFDLFLIRNLRVAQCADSTASSLDLIYLTCRMRGPVYCYGQKP